MYIIIDLEWISRQVAYICNRNTSIYFWRINKRQSCKISNENVPYNDLWKCFHKMVRFHIDTDTSVQYTGNNTDLAYFIDHDENIRNIFRH